jgi:transglutaminase-like putative cysteine protease
MSQTNLEETPFLNFNHPVFADFDHYKHRENKVELAIELYLFVRDYFLYDPFHLDLRSEALIASNIFLKNRAWCVEKSIVLAALLRKVDIPARLGFAIVTNHLGMDRLQQYLRKNEIVFHGYVECFLDGKWVKCTPAFDKRICRVSGVEPLEWDGKQDSLLQAFNGSKQFMEYNHFYGSFQDLPLMFMNQEMYNHYPHLFEKRWNSKDFSFHHLPIDAIL